MAKYAKTTKNERIDNNRANEHKKNKRKKAESVFQLGVPGKIAWLHIESSIAQPLLFRAAPLWPRVSGRLGGLSDSSLTRRKKEGPSNVYFCSCLRYSRVSTMAKRPVIDGFVPRRSPTTIGSDINRKLPPADLTNFNRPRPPQPDHASRPAARAAAVSNNETNALEPTQAHGLTRSDIDESLREIDQPKEGKKTGRRKHKGGKSPRRRRIIKWVIIALLIAGVGIGIWVGVTALLAGSSVFKGDIFGIVQQKKLKVDENGRSNVLIFGTSEDDEGGDHPGAFLTDSIMVLSLNQESKDAYMVSIPRDLWVDFGTGCNAGYRGKINELFNCHSNAGNDKEAGALALAKKVGEVTGLDVQYYAHINYTVVRQAVDAVGGVDVKIESSDPRGILDRNFDWKCKYKCYYVNYKNGEVAHMDGEHALAFMRARNAQGGYGLPGGNFDREQNQQRVVKALREKAMSVGTLANPAKVTGLMNAMGGNLSTNFDTSEIRTLISLAQDVPSESIVSISLVEEGDMVMTTGNLNGVSIVRPVAGISDFSEVHKYISKKINASPISREEPHIIVLNASGVAGAAQTAADKLDALGMTVDAVDNAPQGEYTKNVIYRVGEKAKTNTAAKLKSLYGAEPQAVASVPGVTIGEKTDYVVILVKVPEPTSTAQ